MEAPRILKYTNVDRCVNFGFYPKILPYKKGSILDSHLPKKVILCDFESRKEYPAELIELVPFNIAIPSLFSKMARNLDPETLRIQLLKEYPDKQVEDFAFYLYEFKTTTNE
jgi:hypothetical protein